MTFKEQNGVDVQVGSNESVSSVVVSYAPHALPPVNGKQKDPSNVPLRLI